MSEAQRRIAVVTGASGYLGRALSRRLVRDGVVVQAVTRNPWRLEPGTEAVDADVHDATALARAFVGADVVFHLAAHAHDTTARDDTPQQRHTTLGSTLAVIEAATQAELPALIFVSSLAVFGPTGNEIVDETYPCNPATPYGRAKLEAERAVSEFASRTGAIAASIRPAMIYGPDAPGNLPKMIRAVEQGIFLPIPEFGNRRSFVAVEDVVEAIVLAWSHRVRIGRAYIVTDDTPVSTRQIFDAIRVALGRNPSKFYVPAPILRALALAGDLGGTLLGRRMPFDRVSLSRLADSAAFSCARAMAELDYRPTTTLTRELPVIVAAMHATRPTGSGALPTR